MQRREFIGLLGGAATAWPVAVWAQQSALPVIGWLASTSPQSQGHFATAFRQGLKDAGFIEGQNVTIEYRWAQDQNDRLPALAADLVAARVALIATAGGTVAALAAKAATSTIPIVFVAGADPVETGLVASLNRPGGNVTGVGVSTETLEAKKLELLRDSIPQIKSVAMMLDPAAPVFETQSKAFQAAAHTIGLQAYIVHVQTEGGLDMAFATLVQQGADALIVASDPFFDSIRNRLVALAAHHAMPTIYDRRELVVAGGLMSYGASFVAAHHLAGVYAGRILKGEKPSNLPVALPTVFELVVNLKAAKAIGLRIPESFLARADEVIE
jgi:putative ABC transport system substrate-binding protein